MGAKISRRVFVIESFDRYEATSEILGIFSNFREAVESLDFFSYSKVWVEGGSLKLHRCSVNHLLLEGWPETIICLSSTSSTFDKDKTRAKYFKVLPERYNRDIVL